MAEPSAEPCKDPEDRSAPSITIDVHRFRVLELSSEIFLVDDETGRSVQIGPHGRRVWILLGAGASIEEAAMMLSVETGGRSTVVLEDTCRLVADFVEMGAVTGFTP